MHVPHFITHYVDVRGRCPNGIYWRFIGLSQLLLTLLALPFILFAWERLLADTAILDFLIELIDQASLRGTIAQESMSQVPDLLQGWWAQVLQDFWLSDALTRYSTLAAITLGAFFLPPTLSMSICRLRDSGSSPFWMLLLLPVLASSSQPLLSEDVWVQILSNLSLIAQITLLAMLCKASKPL